MPGLCGGKVKIGSSFVERAGLRTSIPSKFKRLYADLHVQGGIRELSYARILTRVSGEAYGSPCMPIQGKGDLNIR